MLINILIVLFGALQILVDPYTDGKTGQTAFVVNLLADIAEEAQHHPDIMISYSKVTISLTTHEAGGITDDDIELADRIGNLVD